MAPSVTAVMLVNGRADMARAAVRCFESQTYEDKALYVLDTGAVSVSLVGHLQSHMPVWEGRTIGALRNEANHMALKSNIIVHFDSDDWSHPNRIAEQVALLQASGADCVGYREVLFWDGRDAETEGCGIAGSWARGHKGQAYLYTNNDHRYVIGSSMAYTRASWERNPFQDRNRAEDHEFIKRVRTVGVSALENREPRLVCRIHSGNTNHYPIDDLILNSPNWRRAEQFDTYARSAMENL